MEIFDLQIIFYFQLFLPANVRHRQRVTSTTWGSLPPCKQADSFPGFYPTRVGENPGNEVGKQALNQEYSQDETKKTIKVLQVNVVLSPSRYKESQIISNSWRSLRCPILSTRGGMIRQGVWEGDKGGQANWKRSLNSQDLEMYGRQTMNNHIKMRLGCKNPHTTTDS